MRKIEIQDWMYDDLEKIAAKNDMTICEVVEYFIDCYDTKESKINLE
jgi:hypothetical protein